jgi:hypothetical protein
MVPGREVFAHDGYSFGVETYIKLGPVNLPTIVHAELAADYTICKRRDSQVVDIRVGDLHGFVPAHKPTSFGAAKH